MSQKLCEFIVRDIYDACPVLQEQSKRGEAAYTLDKRFVWKRTGKPKKSDLAIGHPEGDIELETPYGIPKAEALRSVLISLEAKATMTEHNKSKPRLTDELTSSYEIVNRGYPKAIAAGLEVLNIAVRYVSPTRQQGTEEPIITKHNQPYAATDVINHLRRDLVIRNDITEIGFDAMAIVVVNVENLPLEIEPNPKVEIWTNPPAPQPNEPLHYETFVSRIARLYAERFSNLDDLDAERAVE